MPWLELRLAVLGLQAAKRMHLEAVEARLDARRFIELQRLRVTFRPSRWGKADRELWREHRAVLRSLRALAKEHHARVLAARRAEDRCPACW
jgi:hypothetical protein